MNKDNVVYKGKFLRVVESIIGSIRVLKFQWNRLDESSDSIKAAHGIGTKLVREKGIKDLVAEVQFSKGALPKDIEEDFWPKQLDIYAADGVENIITVNPEKSDENGALIRLKSANWTNTTKMKNIKIRNIYKKDLFNEILNIAVERQKKE